MKRFAAVTLAALMLLAVFASAASAATVSSNTLEIRGPVQNGTSVATILQANGGNVTWDATQFAAFYYDINDNVSTESLSIIKAGTANNVIPEDGLKYKTEVKTTDFEYEPWGKFNVLGFFAEKYIPLKATDASKLAKLVKDSDDKVLLKTGEKIDLGEGYTIEAKQVDVDGNKVWIEFAKDGQYIDDEIVAANATWTCEQDKVQGEDDVPVLKVHVNQVFQGAVDSVAQIDGLWLIDYKNAIKIESDSEYGKLDNVKLNVGGANIEITNEDDITLTRDSDVEIGQGMFFKVADTPTNVIRFYVYKEITEPGTYEVRGQVATGAMTWDATKFAGFYYDLKNDIKSESMAVSQITSGNVIPDGALTYSTSVQEKEYEFEPWGKFPVLGFFAEEYIPLKKTDASKLAKLVRDSDDKVLLKTGEKIDLGEGYTIEAKQVDVDGNKVWIEFSKDGQYIDDEIVAANGTWNCERDKVQGEDDVVVLKVHVNQVFQGAVDSVAQIDGLWLIDYANALKIESDSEYGKLDNVKLNVGGANIVINNDDDLTLTRDSDVDIGQGLFFKVADTPVSELRYYPYVEKTIGNETTGGNVSETPSGNETAPVNETVTPSGNETPAVTETGAAGETPATGATPATTGAGNATSTEKKPTPGFEGVALGISGLLAVLYYVRRNR
jgi:S-layer protein (TIGR01567 family)